MTYIVTNHKMW